MISDERELISKANLKWQEIFMENPTWELTFGNKTGYCRCKLFSTSHCMLSYEGRGFNWKEARANAAQKFLTDVEILLD